MTSARGATVRAETFRALRLEHVTRSFGGTVALDGLSLSISAGEFVALLGPSGCGKSTALNCLAGLLPLTGGEIHLDDERIDVLPPERRDFGMVFQSYALFPHLSVRRNVGFGLQMRHVPKAELHARVAEALDLVHLSAHAEKMPRQLSGGQQQRVAIARAIAMRPRVVLMDEPLSNLDAQLRLEMRAEIRRLHRELGLTTVYVTHDQEEALALADRLVVLRDGVCQQIGTPEQVYDNPANLYVAGFMGYRNILPATIERVDAGHATVGGVGLTLTGRVTRAPGQQVRVGDAAVVAFRPDDVRCASPVPDGNRIDVVVDVVEYHGRQLAVSGLTASGKRLWFPSADRLAIGATASLHVPTDKLLVFPAATDADPDAVDVSTSPTVIERDDVPVEV